MTADTKSDASKKRGARAIKTLRGMRDIMPEDQLYWDFLRMQAREFSQSYGFERIDLPLLEAEQLFNRTVGKTSDVVQKEMYAFVDQGGDKVALRPEATASVARAYVEHGMLNKPQPVKLFYEGAMFRRERPQAGRYRQFHQFGFEALGSLDPLLDAQIIFMNHRLLATVGVANMVHINSIGDAESRPNYQKVLVSYYRTKRSELCEDCRKRLTKNPLRLLDCKEEGCKEVAQQAPQSVDYLSEECREHFMQVLDYLDEMEVPYFLDHTLVRGLDYYTRTVFEYMPDTDDEQTRQAALGGGGRYDELVELVGGRPTPAVGVAIGMERVINAMKALEVEIPGGGCEIFVAQIGLEAKKKSMLLFEALREAGLSVSESFAKEGLKSQLEVANKRGVKYALILGQKEIMDGTIMVRDMENGIQEIVDFKKVVPELEKRLSKQLTIKKERMAKKKAVVKSEKES